jgi:hypothetical protein
VTSTVVILLVTTVINFGAGFFTRRRLLESIRKRPRLAKSVLYIVAAIVELSSYLLLTAAVGVYILRYGEYGPMMIAIGVAVAAVASLVFMSYCETLQELPKRKPFS